ncbi:MipA/OmpV family protein [Rheinheimera baltica]|uniref:MipA/OmpV family protein n=1 Tax=Rheinheimera baltica TaxID=67576 RepID=UPI00273D730B|nr:MipA/OmpV family protein [Rheinheimera baltica]MDP5149715.1 MipA/OmpV family protein [Rheinheimera baltica]
MNYAVQASRWLISSMLLCVTASAIAQNTASPDRNITGFEAGNEAQPLWEFGVGGGLGQVPNYPASSEHNVIALAAPYVVYRGDVFRIGDGNARAVVVEGSDIEIDISVGGAFSADSDDNTAREGMPELDFLFEIGPQLIYRIKDFSFDNGGNARLNAHLQARSVFSTDFGRIDHRGYVFQPELSYQQRGALFEDTAFQASFSLIFATEKLQDYFYQIDDQFVSNARSAFDASGGFLGAELAAGISFSLHKNIRGFAGGSIKSHYGAANRSSPLFEKDITYSVGVGFIWRLHQSEAKATW